MKLFIVTLLVVCTLPAQGQIPNTISKQDKVYALSQFWQEVNYNFVYLEKVDRKTWDSTYRALIPLVQETPNDYEYFRLLQKFCALLKDGHTGISFSDTIGKLLLNSMFGKYRLFINNIENKAIITRTNLSARDEIPPGSEIIEVNGQLTREYLREHVSPYISSSTQYVLEDNSISTMLQGMTGDKYRITIKTPKNEIKKLSLSHARTIETEVYPPFDSQQLLEVRWYDHSIAYVALNSFQNALIDTLFLRRLPELYKAKALIIDLRNNGGGSTGIGRAILDYLTNDSLLYGSRQITRLHLPAHKAWGAFVNAEDTVGDSWARKSFLHFHDKMYHAFEYEPDKNTATGRRLVVPTALLIGHQTASAAEDFLIYADNQKHMVKMGENSYGSTGQPYMFRLPGGGSARVCTKKDTYPDGREFVGYGVKPDIEIHRTVSDLLQKKDPVLEAALKYLTSKLQ